MNISPGEYSTLVKKATPNSSTGIDMVKAFIVGGTICVIGQALWDMYVSFGIDTRDASALVSATLIFVGSVLTALGVYDKIALIGKAGTLVPITGFANSIVSPAMEYRAEGLILGVGAKMFTIAGPVIVYGTVASVVYGFIYWVSTLFL